MFSTCWGVRFLGVDIAFTGWGVLSGFMWVLGGTGGVYAIRMAGLAIAVGTWGSIMVLVNFIFGILIFREPIHDIWGTMGAFLLLILGLVGMSHFSRPQPKETSKGSIELDENKRMEGDHIENSGTDYHELEPGVLERDEPTSDGIHCQIKDSSASDVSKEAYTVLFGRFPLTKRQCGILGAVWNGCLTGSSLIPLHYAKEQGFGGARYMVSMACGAFMSNCCLWLTIFLYKMKATSNYSIIGVLQTMPDWHFRQLCLPGIMAGILQSMAMFGSILSITYLGQGVGNSIVQTKILVSGLWGILWFKEITGRVTIVNWFLAATTAVIAIICLSLERIYAQAH